MPKTIKCVFLQKRVSKLETDIYRHISFLSFLNKILDRAAYDRVSDFPDKHDLLYMKQFGFCAETSTLHALNEMTEKLR